MVSLEGYKKKLCEYFTFSDRTENEHIVIGHVIGGADLKRKISTSKMRKKLDQVDLDIVVDTSQQPFSLYTFSKMKVLFSLKTNSYDHLPCIEIESQKKSGIVMYKASLPITSVNEATCCEFISVIIYGVTSIFNGTVKVYPQYEVSRSHGKGPIDWMIKMGDTIISVN
ncbi:hypothetical protein RhiirA4_449646 [Rhizophagus irregularis]|uniref:Uncharacterized protein n=1 Tax=Rhizophagus irregularis TaxID=588596 RepID=A0A2I1HNB3_9GLOM|nr:hypothetical protein RhiirA4_449646 [Rhizophagus irregularis]